MSGQDDRLVRRSVEAAARRVAGGPCPEPDVLGLYTDRGLDDAERGLVEDHLAGCPRCQATVAALVRSAPEAADVAGAAETGAGGVRAWWTGWRWLVPATATAAVVTLAIWVGRGPSERAAEADREVAPAPPAATAASPADRRQLEAPLAARSDPAAPALRAGAASFAEPRSPAAPGAGRRPTQRSGAAASETRLERAEPQRQREEAPVGSPAGQARPEATAAPTPAAPANAAPAGSTRTPLPPPPASAAPPPPPAPGQPPGTIQETITVAEAPARAPGAPTARTSERNAADQAAAGAMAKATASDTGATTRRMVELTGRVTYRTRQALPAGAIIEVQLLDVSRADAPAQPLGRTSIVTKGEQVPVPFAVAYDAGTIDARRRYVVQATITIAGRVAFRTTTAHPVLTSGGSGTDLEVVVQPVR